ncbi:major capsid protein [Nitriliruptor alkaliphilus]|uniref:major capsid protein n=1 Tax=Nitriliruptor alkaliphilus TaxID=427918 RepID=UPI00069785C0|nr:major capsid protein [Nitriliruptor alkaliphilus]
MDLATLRRTLAALAAADVLTAAAVTRADGWAADLDEVPTADLDATEADLIAAFDAADPGDDADPDTHDLDLMGLAASAIECVRSLRQARRNQVRELVASVRPGETLTRPSLADAARHQRRDSHPRTPRADVRALTAAGAEVDGPGVARAFLDQLRSVPRSGEFRSRVATLHLDVPEERQLGADVHTNVERVAAVVGDDALVAAGGLCAPISARYEVDTIASDHRPIRDALPVFGAERGGVRLLTAPSLADASTGTVVWTEANDRRILAEDFDNSPADGEDPPGPDFGMYATKPTWTLECGSEVEVLVHAVTRRVAFGNFHARTHPEAVQAAVRMLTAAHARTAEQELWSSIVSAATSVTADAELGAARDLLTTLDRATAGYRSRQRLAPTARLRVVLPEWARHLVRADVAKQLPGDDALGVTDEQIGAWFTARGIAPVWSPDVQPIGGQDTGALVAFPSTVEFVVAAEGAFLFLDGGSLDLGLVRDSTLNSTNQVESFAETFEGVAAVGHEALHVTQTTAAYGASSGTIDLTA